MGLPVLGVDICVRNGISAVNHPVFAHINAHMGNTICLVGALEEHQITGTGIAAGNRGAEVVNSPSD